MSIWVAGIVVIAIALVASVVAYGGKGKRALRKELRLLRKEGSHGPDTHTAAELRRNMYMDPMPGKDTTPGGP